MKAATGELNLTVITLIAIGAVIGFFWIMWPQIQESLNSQWTTVNNRDSSEELGGWGTGYITNNYDIIINQ